MKRIQGDESASCVFDDIAVWRVKLPKVKFAVLPPFNKRPNPLVTEDVVYASVFSPGAVIALERGTGKLVWRRNIPRFGSSSAYLSHGRLLAETANTVYALDPETGDTLWTFCPYGKSGETIYSQPTIYRDSVFIGDRYGFLHCLDSKTGKTKWKALTSRAKNRAVNSTPLVSNGLVIVSTNAKRAVAFDTRTGSQVWVSKIDGPATFGPLLCGNLLAVVTNSIHLLQPKSGKIVRKFSWRREWTRGVECMQRDILATVVRSQPSDGSIKLVRLNKDGIRFINTFRAFVPFVRYVPETKLIYVSHLEGIDIRRPQTGALASKIKRRARPAGNGLVDVRDNTIYVLTEDGYVYALRHPRLKR